MKKGNYLSEEKRELSEDMNYRETVRSVCAFLGWNFIPDFELDTGGTDSSKNPWKEKIPRKPVKFQWKCQLITRCVKKCYPSRSQDEGGS